MLEFTRFDMSNKKQIAEAAEILANAYSYHKDGIFTKAEAAEYALSEAETTTPQPTVNNFKEMITILEDCISNNGTIRSKKKTGRQAVVLAACRMITKKPAQQEKKRIVPQRIKPTLSERDMKAYSAGYDMGFTGAVFTLKVWGIINEDFTKHLLDTHDRSKKANQGEVHVRLKKEEILEEINNKEINSLLFE